MKADKHTRQLARQLFKLSFADGLLSSERVAGVLEYIVKDQARCALPLTREYRRLVATELARTHAVIEHAGPVSDSTVAQIAAAMTRRYGRPITAAPKSAPELLAGLRVRVGDDVYDASVKNTLQVLAAATGTES